jgi:hypothetical protein
VLTAAAAAVQRQGSKPPVPELAALKLELEHGPARP